jgi:hypothetical protein
VQYTVEVQKVGNTGTPVTLHVYGSLSMQFDLEDQLLVPPATTTLTLTVPDGMEGIEEFTIIGSANGNQSSVVGEVVLVTGSLVPPILQEPPDGAQDVTNMPTLTWLPSSGSGSFNLEVASDSDFNDVVYSAVAYGSSHTVKNNLTYGSDYYWRICSDSACGTSDWSPTSMFTVAGGVVVLLVDDDDNDPDIRDYYTTGLENLGILYDIWDTDNSDNEPPIETLRDYGLVIWFTGAEWGGYAGPGPDGETALATYLDEGGVLWVSSQDYLYDRGLTPFLNTYLGVSDYDSDVGQEVVTGTGDLFGGYGTLTLTCPFNNYTDELEATSSAQLGFIGDIGPIGLTVETETWRTVFWAFPLEAVLDQTVRDSLLRTVIEWVPKDEGEPCPADIVVDEDVNITDLLFVLSEWGDIGGVADINDDNIVDVLDLLSVISFWGACH